MHVEGDSLLIGRHIHHSAFSLADGSFSQSDEGEVWEVEYTTCRAPPLGACGASAPAAGLLPPATLPVGNPPPCLSQGGKEVWVRSCQDWALRMGGWCE
jgi:hypothetical protein